MRLSEIDLDQRARELGWLGPLPRDPGEDPPNLRNFKYEPWPRPRQETKP